MWQNVDIPWMKIDDFLLSAERTSSPKTFADLVIKKIYNLIPYDQARVYLINGNGKVYDKILLKVEQEWDDAYHQYFSNIENGRFSLTRPFEGSIPIFGREGGIVDWSRKSPDEFLEYYIKPQGISHSAGFRLKDEDNIIKSIFCIDRVGHSGFSQLEIEIITKVIPHLENLFRNVTILGLICQNQQNTQLKEVLTNREYEIVELLSKGLPPKKIGDEFGISLQTVYRHIANIYSKLNISSRQELLLKVHNFGGFDKSVIMNFRTNYKD